MKKFKKHSELSPSRIFGAIFFILLMVGLVVFTITYDPDKQFSSSFFEDVSNAIRWK